MTNARTFASDPQTFTGPSYDATFLATLDVDTAIDELVTATEQTQGAAVVGHVAGRTLLDDADDLQALVSRLRQLAEERLEAEQAAENAAVGDRITGILWAGKMLDGDQARDLLDSGGLVITWDQDGQAQGKIGQADVIINFASVTEHIFDEIEEEMHLALRECRPSDPAEERYTSGSRACSLEEAGEICVCGHRVGYHGQSGCNRVRCDCMRSYR